MTQFMDKRRFARRLKFVVVGMLGVLCWQLVAALTVSVVLLGIMLPEPGIAWLYDWHVYAAGAHDLIGGDLYRVPLRFSGWPLPVDTYNLPPLSAVWPLPLLWLPDEPAGVIWIAIGAVAWSSAWWIAFKLIGIRVAWMWTGVALAVYATVFYWFSANIILGNVNHLILGGLAAFALAHVRGRATLAGVLLGLAMATKLWPSVILLVLVRERSWHTAGWALGTAAVTTLLPLAWLGPDAIGPMLDALRLQVPLEPGVTVLWTSAFRLVWDWWPSWGAIAVGIGLLAIPVRGLPGMGLAIIAGITLIPNIWDHYLPTMLFALAFVLTAIRLPTWQPDPLHAAEAR